MELILEAREQADLTAKLTGPKGKNEKGPPPVLMVTPPISEGYWRYRVKVSDRQAVIGFPKFNTIGIGFQREVDWNTNLPYRCDVEKIYQHIEHNRDGADPELCRKAIQMIKDAATAERGPG